ncbi:BrnT family toxin [Salmonella enterica]
MEIDYDNNKRNRTLSERGLDFARAAEVFAGKHFTAEDMRQDYGEIRYITAGTLDGCIVVLVWTPRDNARRIISMRKANEREKARFKKHQE